jgi:UDP-glucose 4-epimerase
VADVEDFTAFLHALRPIQPLPRIVLLSSGGTIYGDPATPPYREDDPPQPVNAYGEAKLAQESALAEWQGSSVALRIANAYGPGQVAAPGQGVLAHWVRDALEGKPITLFGSPQSTRDYVYAADIARAVVAVHQHEGELPAAINIGSGVATTLDSLLEAFREAVAPVVIESRWEDARVTDASHSVLDISLAKATLQWAPTVNLVEGIRAQWREASS